MNFDLDLWFTMEVKKGDELVRAYMLQPNVHQFYRTTDLHKRPHFILNGLFDVLQYQESLIERGFVECKPEDLADDYLQEQVFTIIPNVGDHVLKEITVFNELGDRETTNLIKLLKLRAIAEHIAALNCKAPPSDARDNFRVDVGFSGQNSTDPSVFPGMYVAAFTSHWDSYPGLGKDKNLTETIIKAGIALRRLVNHLMATKLDKPWDDFKDVEDDRTWMFPQREARQRGIEGWEDFVLQGTTFGMNGTLPNGRNHILRPHVDGQNARDAPFNAYWGMVVYEDLVYPGGVFARNVRNGLGGYGKNSLSSAYIRRASNDAVVTKMRQFRRRWPDRFQFDFGHLDMPSDVKFKVVSPPHVDKSLYYSVYIHGLLQLAKATNNDKGVMFEAVVAMGLTACPEGWFYGLMEAAKIRNGRNLITTFIHVMKTKRGGVARGRGPRRQTSSGRQVVAGDLFASARNLIHLCKLGTDSNNTDELVKSWVETPEGGGVWGAGELTCQEQISVLTSVLEIGNDVHHCTPRICKGTKTYDMMKDWGYSDDAKRKEILRYVAAEMNLDIIETEELFCLVRREKEKTIFRFYDTFVNGQPVFVLKGGALYSIDRDGVKSLVQLPRWKFDAASYHGGVRWWADDFDASSLRDKIRLAEEGGD